MDPPTIEYRDYRPEYALETVTMWRRAFHRAMSLPEHAPPGALTAHLAWFAAVSPSTVRVAVDAASGAVVAMVVLDGCLHHHLYVHVDYQDLGIGSTFLAEAKAASPTGLELFTFQRNATARAFYLSRGFVEVARGHADPASNPWAASRDQLADIKYRWKPAGCEPG